jgi:hypothetical protein
MVRGISIANALPGRMVNASPESEIPAESLSCNKIVAYTRGAIRPVLYKRAGSGGPVLCLVESCIVRFSNYDHSGVVDTNAAYDTGGYCGVPYGSASR